MLALRDTEANSASRGVHDLPITMQFGSSLTHLVTGLETCLVAEKANTLIQMAVRRAEPTNPTRGIGFLSWPWETDEQTLALADNASVSALHSKITIIKFDARPRRVICRLLYSIIGQMSVTAYTTASIQS